MNRQDVNIDQLKARLDHNIKNPPTLNCTQLLYDCKSALEEQERELDKFRNSEQRPDRVTLQTEHSENWKPKCNCMERAPTYPVFREFEHFEDCPLYQPNNPGHGLDQMFGWRAGTSEKLGLQAVYQAQDKMLRRLAEAVGMSDAKTFYPIADKIIELQSTLAQRDPEIAKLKEGKSYLEDLLGTLDLQLQQAKVLMAERERQYAEMLKVLQEHHGWHLEAPVVYFQQDGKPHEMPTDLAMAYVESELCEKTCAVFKGKDGEPFGYVCPVCQTGIKDNEPTVHTEDGMAHEVCPTDCGNNNVAKEELMRVVKEASEFAYVKGCELSKRTECLAWEWKLQNSKFGEPEFKAHGDMAEFFGYHRLLNQDLLPRLKSLLK